MTWSQQQCHSYRASPEPLKVIHAYFFLSQLTPWPRCPGSQPGIEQKSRSTVLYLMALYSLLRASWTVLELRRVKANSPVRSTIILEVLNI